MRFLMMVKATEESEAGIPPRPEQLAAMGQLMEDMARAGILMGGEGLQPSSKGKRIKISGGKVAGVTDGPFAETKEVIAGYALVKVKTWDELQPWMERFAAAQGDGEAEIRPLYEAADFISEDFSPEDAAREEALRQQISRQPQAGSDRQ